MSVRISGCSAMAIAAALIVSSAAADTAWAQDVSPVAAVAVSYDVPAGPLGDSLVAIAKASGLTITIDQALVASKRARAVRGKYTPDQAFALALSGSNLHIERADGNSLMLAPGAVVDTAGAEGRVLSTVRVAGVDDGAQGGYVSTGGAIVMPGQGANGSSDTLATEGTDSYAPIGTQLATGAPSSIHDTPYSVSAVTRARIDDSRLQTFFDALNALPGITVTPVTGTGSQVTYTSRGFGITNYQVDGNAPFVTSQSNASGYFPQFDLSEFDNVSVIRGGDALASGFGEPGGTVNLQRKRPVAGRQVLIDLSAGSWDKYRGSIDFSTPLVSDGLVKLRVVATHDQQGYFFDRARLSHDLLYANFEIAPDSRTSLNLGAAIRWEYGRDWQGGLPLYTDGTLLNLPRSTCLCFNDDHANRRTIEAFLKFAHDFSKSWRIRANLDYQVFRNVYSYSYPYAPAGIFPGNTRAGVGPSFVSLLGSYGNRKSRGLTGGVEVDGSVRLLGRLHTFTIGYAFNDQKIIRSDGGTYTVDAYDDLSDPNERFNIFAFDPNADRGARTYSPDTSFISGRTSQSSVYGQFRFNPFKGLWLTISDRYQWYRNYYDSSYATYDDRVRGVQKPAVTAKYDLTKNVNVYGSLSFIDGSVIAPSLDGNLKPLPPVKGRNLEGGIKFQSGNGRFNASAAYFATEQQNLAVFDFNTTQRLNYPLNCCYVGGYNLQNAGVDLEMNGSLTRDWQASFGYTYMFRQRVAASVDPTQYFVPPVYNRQPKHVLKLATAYTVRNGLLRGLTFGGSAHYQSEASSDAYLYNINSLNDVVFFPPYAFFTNSYQAVIRQPAYTLVNAFARYQITPGLSVQLNVGNIFDKKYYSAASSLQLGNWYGEPRSAQVSLKAKF